MQTPPMADQDEQQSALDQSLKGFSRPGEVTI